MKGQSMEIDLDLVESVIYNISLEGEMKRYPIQNDEQSSAIEIPSS